MTVSVGYVDYLLMDVALTVDSLEMTAHWVSV